MHGVMSSAGEAADAEEEEEGQRGMLLSLLRTGGPSQMAVGGVAWASKAEEDLEILGMPLSR